LQNEGLWGGENVDLVKGVVDLIEKEKEKHFFQLQVIQLFPLALEKV